MFSFETTTLWKSSLGSQTGTAPAKVIRQKLRHAFLNMRERAATLAGEIPGDLPFFTVHDITHLDALWETASTIAGSKFILTPPEAFVLGGAFLVHDLAMSQAAYPEGLDALAKETSARDMTAALLRRNLGRAPTPEELENPTEDVAQQILKDLLRINHARQAERLPTATWQATSAGESFHLIEDPELRENYGQIMGRIAHSHWWHVDELIAEFSEPLGAPGGYPPKWEVDALKVAALLRVADASHLDDRRAPSFLWALRKPKGVSEEHWRFQNYLLQPRLVADRIAYSAKRPFKVEDATAWWFCYDALQMVDGELRRVDALLADVGGRPRLAARGVAKVETPERLSESVKTKGWLPVDARIRVTDVAGLARHIGGEQLYGNNQIIPIRELIQNASDAIRARRLLENRSSDWGEVCVRFGQDAGGEWIEVEDNGIGMSVNVLKGPLLDFGTSYWGSEQVIRDLPGLLSKGFQPTGQYGIGFFSVFMWGDRVRVTTLRAGEAQRNTSVLEFGSGLTARPLLREAREEEIRLEGGTAVRIWPSRFSIGPDGRLLGRLRWRTARTIQDLCKAICLALDVNLFVEREREGRELVIPTNDWLTMDGSELLRRAWTWEFGREVEAIDLAAMAANLRLLENSSGEVFGRVCLCPTSAGVGQSLRGTITVGGLRAARIFSILGIVLGQPERATRDRAFPIADTATWARWASEQADLVSNISREPDFLEDCAKLIRELEGDTGNLPIASGERGRVSARDILRWVNLPDELLLVHGAYEFKRNPFTPIANTLVANSYGSRPMWMQKANPGARRWERLLVHEDEFEPGYLNLLSLQAAVIEALARAWGATFEEVLKASDFSSPERIVGKRGRKSVKAPAATIRNPRAPRS